MGSRIRSRWPYAGIRRAQKRHSPLGCGNGGLDWSEVGPLIYQKLHRLPIDVEVFAPYGTPTAELRTEFLEKPAQLSLEGKGRRLEKMNPGWIALIEVLKELEEQPYAPPVGRTIFLHTRSVGQRALLRRRKHALHGQIVI